MSRMRRTVAAFLLTLAVALPVAALPDTEGAPRLWPGLLSGLWDHIAPILGLAEGSRAGADPDGLPAPTPPPSEGSTTVQATEGDSRAGADPDG